MDRNERLRGARLVIAAALALAPACGALPEGEGASAAPGGGDVVVQRAALTQEGNQRWNDYNKLDLTYCVDSSLAAYRDKVVSVLDEATKDWATDVQIAFRYLPDVQQDCLTNPLARIRFSFGYSYGCVNPDGSTSLYRTPLTCPGGAPLEAFPNTTGFNDAEQWARIDFVYATLEGPRSDLLVTAKHELGHALGFDHEDGTLGCSTNHVAGDRPLTAPDPNSIMLTSNCPLPLSGTLSALDRQGAGLLYGHVADTTISSGPHTMTRGSWFTAVWPMAVGNDRSFTTSITGTGDLDLYVGVGFQPTLFRFSGASNDSWSTETVTLQLPIAPFGQDVFVSVYAYTDGTLQTWTKKAKTLANPMDIVANVGTESAAFDASVAHPACAHASTSCTSGVGLKGRGQLRGGVEPNAPNRGGGSGCVDGNLGTYAVDESIESITVRSADSGPLRSAGNAVVDVSVMSWSTTVDRLDLYYREEQSAPWRLIASRAPPATGFTTMSFPMQILYGGPVQTVRALFRYNPGSISSCPADMGAYDDIDDLNFTIAPVYSGDVFP
jgi:hypothetical protein